MSDLSPYWLRKWSLYIRARDGVCQLCNNKDVDIKYLQAHHIDPKSLFPEKAYDLNNGIALHRDCHLRIIHSTDDWHKQFRHNFVRHNKRVAAKRFNEKYQYKLDGAP